MSVIPQGVQAPRFVTCGQVMRRLRGSSRRPAVVAIRAPSRRARRYVTGELLACRWVTLLRALSIPFHSQESRRGEAGGKPE